MSGKFKIAIVVSHPIQHFCPQYASFAKNKNIQLKVFFASTLGYKPYLDKNFGKELIWSNLYLEEFDHVFLNNGELLKSDRKLDAPEIEGELETYNPDLIIIYGYLHKLQRRTFNWARYNKKKVAYISDSERKRKISLWREWLKYPYLYWFFSKINYFLTVGDANEGYYKYHGISNAKMLRMHFPIDIRNYALAYQNKLSKREEIRKKYGVDTETVLVSVVGKLVSWKSQITIIEALKLLELKNVRVDAIIIGTGQEFEMLKEQAGNLLTNKVHFSGFVDPSELPAYYAATDIYIHPAFFEPHSLAISEAIYMGCPVIISDRCGSYGANDDVQENVNGFVYRFGIINELCEKISHLVKNPETRIRFGEISHRNAEIFQECSHNGIIQKIMSVEGAF